MANILKRLRQIEESSAFGACLWVAVAVVFAVTFWTSPPSANHFRVLHFAIELWSFLSPLFFQLWQLFIQLWHLLSSLLTPLAELVAPYALPLAVLCAVLGWIVDRIEKAIAARELRKAMVEPHGFRDGRLGSAAEKGVEPPKLSPGDRIQLFAHRVGLVLLCILLIFPGSVLLMV